MSAIDEVKARLDIVDVVGQYVQLQKAGRSFKALCPFHAEKTPSFIVSPERQSWHCFGACGTGGDIFAFVMRKESLEFVQVLQLLAEKAGVRLPEHRRSEEGEGQRERLRAANEAAAEWYHHLLLNSESARSAREYVERRGIDARTAETFLLGYSLPEWEALRQHLGKRGHSDAEMLAAGLLVEGEKGLHDRFRGRLMFPIRDMRGRLIGFGARALDESLPKYLNTSQTAIFDKGSTLYGLDRAAEGIRKNGRAVIVEGYTDVIAAHQHGFDNVVASMGTALTEQQVRLLKRQAGKLVVALDADIAGSEATLRALSLHIEMGTRAQSFNPSPEAASEEEFRQDLFRIQQGIVAGNVDVEVQVMPLPAGKDPDDLIRESPHVWQELMEEAKPLMDFWFDALSQRHDLTSPRERSEMVRELLPVVGIIRDPVVRAHYLQKLSRLALVGENELVAMLARSRGAKRETASAGPATPSLPARGDPLEEFLLALLLRYPALREEGLAFPSELLEQSEIRLLLEAWKQDEGIEAVKEELPEELLPHLERLLNRRLPQYDERGAMEAFYDCRARLEQRRLAIAKQASTALLETEEEELGPSALVEAAASSVEVDDERLREAVGVLRRDMETGLRLHKQEEKDDVGPTADTSTDR